MGRATVRSGRDNSGDGTGRAGGSADVPPSTEATAAGGKNSAGRQQARQGKRAKAETAAPRRHKPANGSRSPRYSRQDPDVRRQQIVEAAVRCLAKGGFGAFTVSEICAEAGISHGLINHYFASKEELLVTAYRHVTDALAHWTRVTLARSGREPEDKLAAIVETSFAPEIFNEDNLAIWLALWGQVRNHPELRRAHNELYDRYRAIVARQIAAIAARRGLEVEAEPLALALTALIDGLWLEWCLDPTVFSATEARHTCYRLLEDRLGTLRRGGEPLVRNA